MEQTFECEENAELILVYSLLSRIGIRIVIKRRGEVIKSFIKMLQSISHGSSYSIDNEHIKFIPGSLSGGECIVRCKDEIWKYLEALLVLCPFICKPLKIRLRGITNGRFCVDLIRIVHFNVMKRFGVYGCEIVVKKRGFGPGGGGEVIFTMAGGKKINTIDIDEEEKILKIRGLVLSSRLCSIPTREMSDRIKEILGDVSNTKVYSNMSNKLDSGPSPGFQCVIFAESKNGIYYSIQNGDDRTPKDTATIGCKELLRSIKNGGVFDKKLMYLSLSYMALSSSNTGRLIICKVDDDIQRILDLLKIFFKFEYEIKKINESYVIDGVGCGLTDISRLLK